MSNRKFMRLAVVMAATVLVPGIATAQSYGTDLANDFVQWCTGTQGQPATVCSCAVSKAAIEIPATAMASFLAAPEGSAAATVSTGIGATALQIVTTCAVGASSTPSTGNIGGALNSLGGFGN